MVVLNQKLKDPLYILGLFLVTVSLLLYAMPVVFAIPVNHSSGGMFLVNFGLTAAYIITLSARGILKRGRNGLHHVIVFLVLFLISAYALNREIPIFERSVNWFSILLVLICINYMMFIFLKDFRIG